MLENMPDYKKPSSTGTNSHCIWMSAGVISYKLCPINYDCENCEFDAVMRQKKMEDQKTAPDVGRK